MAGTYPSSHSGYVSHGGGLDQLERQAAQQYQDWRAAYTDHPMFGRRHLHGRVMSDDKLKKNEQEHAVKQIDAVADFSQEPRWCNCQGPK
jgi:hypothetical protein